MRTMNVVHAHTYTPVVFQAAPDVGDVGHIVITDCDQGVWVVENIGWVGVVGQAAILVLAACTADAHACWLCRASSECAYIVLKR